RLEQGLAALDQAFAAAERNDERFYLAELHRLRGELLGPDPARSGEAERSFAEAVDVARRQDSPVLGRRAAHAFARYLRGRGRLAEAEQMERELHSTFADPPAS